MYGFDRLVCVVPIEARRQHRVLRTGVTDHCEPLLLLRIEPVSSRRTASTLLTTALSPGSRASFCPFTIWLHLLCSGVQVPPTFEFLVFLHYWVLRNLCIFWRHFDKWFANFFFSSPLVFDFFLPLTVLIDLSLIKSLIYKYIFLGFLCGFFFVMSKISAKCQVIKVFICFIPSVL